MKMFWIVWLLATLTTGPIGFILWPIIYFLGELNPRRPHVQ